ncbi:hypothetical protein IJI72_00135 [Candidatus Saccharibacteria bacterium]|nr:hypothetical protein [Candidatus Saccharibacteria bacterium]
MKKLVRLFVVAFAVAAMMALVSEAFCVKAEAKTALETRSDNATTQFVSVANYNGWAVTKRVTSKTSSRIVTTLKAVCNHTGRYFANIQQIVTASKVTYRYKGTDYPFSSWKTAFQQRANVLAIKKTTAALAKAKADLVVKKARSNKWTIKTNKVMTKVSGSTASNLVVTSTATVTVYNSRYSFSVKITVVRKNNKFTYTYVRHNVKVSSINDIYTWLTRYKV